MFRVPTATRYRLSDPPLAQALAQVRFPLTAAWQTLEGIAGIQAELGDIFPEMSPQDVHEVSVYLGPAGPTAPRSETARSWSFAADDDGQVLLSPDSATYSASRTNYAGIEKFSERFETLLSALSRATPRQRLCNRIGVRFLNLSEVSTMSEDPLFKPEVTGWLHSDVLDDSATLTSSVTQTQVTAPPNGVFASAPGPIQGVVRHGVAPLGSTVPGIPPITVEEDSYFLDIDLFISTQQEFSIRNILDQFRSLHNHIDDFFRWTLTDAGLAQFGYAEREEAGV